MMRHSMTLFYLTGCAALLAGGWAILPAQSAPQTTVTRHAAEAPAREIEPPGDYRAGPRPLDRKVVAAARPPVPLLRQPNPVLETALSRGEPARATSTPAPETPPVTVLRPLADTATKAIEADGYKRVRVTERDANGNWRGRAFRGETEVAVSVDDAGNVSLQ